eukprot:411100-Alexandrium_andersonii.AAC.1
MCIRDRLGLALPHGRRDGGQGRLHRLDPLHGLGVRIGEALAHHGRGCLGLVQQLGDVVLGLRRRLHDGARRSRL